MVTFARIPYAAATERARLQDGIVYASLIVLMMSIIAFSILLFR